VASTGSRKFVQAAGGRCEPAALIEAVQEGVQVSAGVAVLANSAWKAEDPGGELVGVGEVAGRQRLAGEDREVDLDLVQS
jgi:hypothetical protein